MFQQYRRGSMFLLVAVTSFCNTITIVVDSNTYEDAFIWNI